MHRNIAEAVAGAGAGAGAGAVVKRGLEMPVVSATRTAHPKAAPALTQNREGEEAAAAAAASKEQEQERETALHHAVKSPLQQP